jgi:hypothetical protein
VRGVVIHVLDDHEVEPPVPVVVDEARRRGPVDGAEAGRAGRLREPAAGIDEQPDRPQLGHDDVRVAVVVHVPDGHAHPEPGHVQPAAGRHVAERPVGLLVVQAVPGPGLGPGVLKEVDVEAAVVVEVEQGPAGPDDLGEEVKRGGARVVIEGQADGVGHVLEPRRPVGPGRRAGGWPGRPAGRAEEEGQPGHQPDDAEPAEPPQPALAVHECPE